MRLLRIAARFALGEEWEELWDVEVWRSVAVESRESFEVKETKVKEEYKS